MFKQSPSRNNRTKGSKAKLVLQICLLLVVCFWLIYQVKRSHDKKAEFDSEDEKVVGKVQSDAEILRLGRKDLPRITESAIDVDEHLLEEEEENKHEDDEQDIEDNKTEDIDENDKEVEKTETDEAHEKDVNEENDDVEEEHDGSTNEDHVEAEEGEKGDNEDHDEGDVKLEEQDSDGDGANANEAREEHYKADDASSEVVNDNQTMMTETGNVSVEHTNKMWSEIGEENESITSNKEDELNKNITSTNATVTEFEGPGNYSVMSEDGTIEGGSGYENATMVGNISEEINKSEIVMDDENHLQSVAGSDRTEYENTNAVESLISDTNTMLVDGQKSEDSGTFDSDENVDVIPRDPIDASDSSLTQGERDSRMDGDTLPEITTEAQNTDDTLAE